MPVSVVNSRLIFDALKACDVKIISALPETWLVHLIRMADEDPEVTLVRVAKEEEAIGISAGAHLAGVNSALLMQNHGFLAAINPIVSLALLYKIPLLMLISYRGHMGERDPWQTQGGMVTADNRGPVGKDLRTWAECLRIGNLLADEAIRIIASAPEQKNPKLFCAAKTISFPVDSPLLREIMASSPLGFRRFA
jgi:sulfopyruvate decarboxylase subunit alpha